jgi:acetylornithine aminotransferase
MSEAGYWARVDIDVCLKCERDTCDLSCDQLASIRMDSVAAFVLEPILGSGGIVVPPKRAVRLLAEQTTQSGGLVVADEVTTGLGRSGYWLGTDILGISPDIIAFGKILGNGYPISAVALRGAVADAIEKAGFQYVQSHQNDPLGCSIAKEVILTLEDGNFVLRSRRLGKHFKRLLQDVAERVGAIKQVRGEGLMLGIELDASGFRNEGYIENIGQDMLDCGYIVGLKPKLSLLRLMPPFTIDEELILSFCRHLEETLLDKTCR